MTWKKLFGLLVGLGSVAASIFIKNPKTQQNVGAIGQMAGDLVETVPDTPIIPPETPKK